MDPSLRDAAKKADGRPVNPFAGSEGTMGQGEPAPPLTTTTLPLMKPPGLEQPHLAGRAYTHPTFVAPEGMGLRNPYSGYRGADEGQPEELYTTLEPTCSSSAPGRFSFTPSTQADSIGTVFDTCTGMLWLVPARPGDNWMRFNPHEMQVDNYYDRDERWWEREVRATPAERARYERELHPEYCVWEGGGKPTEAFLRQCERDGKSLAPELPPADMGP